MTIDWTGFGEIVAKYQRFVLTSHLRPDCDALGSELGMAHILEALGKDVKIVNPQKTPPNLTFIDPEQRILAINEDIKAEQLADREVLLILDTSAWAQLGAMGDFIRATKARKLIMDHHVSEDEFGAELFKDVTVEATGRLVYEAARTLNVPLNAAIATPLLAAVSTDTGWFRFPSTKAETFRCAADLVTAGAQPAALYGQLYEQDTMGRMKLRGMVLSRLVSELDGRLAHTYIVLDDFKVTGALPSDTEDLVNAALSVVGVQVAVISIEQSTRQFKVSFRSRTPAVDCNALAKQFGGGGHRAAAGAMVDGPLEQAQKLVLDAVRAAMR